LDIEKQLQWAKDFREKLDREEVEHFSPDKRYEVDKSEVFIPTGLGNTRVLEYRPKISGILPVYINLHGGGFVVGSADGDDPWCPLIAEEAGCVVYNVDYRLAPEHKFPTAIEEVYSVAKYLFNNALELGVDLNRIAIGGHSAGGNLATAVCMLNIDQGNEIPFVQQILDYPVLDLLTKAEEKPTFKDAIPIDVATMFNVCYLNYSDEAKNPLASPVFAKGLDRMPAALMITAELDSLANEGRVYAERLKEAGVSVYHKEYKDLPHGFNFSGVDFNAALDSWHLMSSQLKKAFGT